MINGRWKHPNIVRSRIEKDIKPHFYFEERRRALEPWGQWLLKLERGGAKAKTGEAKAP